MNTVLDALRGGLVVSCQAYPGEPMLPPIHCLTRTLAGARLAFFAALSFLKRRSSGSISGACTNRVNITTPKAIDCMVHQYGKSTGSDRLSASISAPRRLPRTGPAES